MQVVVDRPKKQRARRGEQVPDDAVLVVRGDLLDPGVLRSDAGDNFDIYGYFGVSVFAEVGGVDLNWIAGHKLSRASWLVVFRAGDVLAAGLQLWDTGQSPDYDLVHDQLDELVARLAACPHPCHSQPQRPTRRHRVNLPAIALIANLNNEDDEGLNWSLLRNAADPSVIVKGAVLRAGTERFWSWVQICRIDEDGQVHFEQISADEVRRRIPRAG